MKLLHYFNVICYLSTLFVYAFYEVTLGLIFQFFFGILQLILFFICVKTSKNKDIRDHLRLYFATVAITFFIYAFLANGNLFSETIAVIFIMILPMLIASYFVTITYLIQKS